MTGANTSPKDLSNRTSTWHRGLQVVFLAAASLLLLDIAASFLIGEVRPPEGFFGPVPPHIVFAVIACAASALFLAKTRETGGSSRLAAWLAFATSFAWLLFVLAVVVFAIAFARYFD